MMPLAFAKKDEKNTIVKVGGNLKTKQFMKTLGFVTGASVIIVNETDGDVIVNIKNARVAVSKEMANRIIVN